MDEAKLRVEALQKMNEAFDLLQEIKRLRSEERTELTRHLQITITDLEKVLAYYYVFVLAGRSNV